MHLKMSKKLMISWENVSYQTGETELDQTWTQLEVYFLQTCQMNFCLIVKTT